MTEGEELADNNHIVRHIRSGLLDETGENLVSIRAFCDDLHKTRPPSVNWLECFAGMDKDDQVQAVRDSMQRKLGGRSRLAELGVRSVTRAGFTKDPDGKERRSDSLRVVCKPLKAKGTYGADRSHCEIIGLPKENSGRLLAISEFLAGRIVKMHRASPERGLKK